MAWFRRRFCNPSEYANEQCAVPVYITVSEETVCFVGMACVIQLSSMHER